MFASVFFIVCNQCQALGIKRYNKCGAYIGVNIICKNLFWIGFSWPIFFSTFTDDDTAKYNGQFVKHTHTHTKLFLSASLGAKQYADLEAAVSRISKMFRLNFCHRNNAQRHPQHKTNCCTSYYNTHTQCCWEYRHANCMYLFISWHHIPKKCMRVQRFRVRSTFSCKN